MYEVTSLEISMIQNMMLSKTNKEISTITDLPMDVVGRVIKELEKDTGLTCRSTMLEQNRQTRPARVKKEKAKPTAIREKITEQTREADMYHAQRKKEYDRKKFETKSVNLDNMQSVRIDEKTTIFIKLGEDPLKAKMAYFEREKAKKDNIFNKS